MCRDGRKSICYDAGKICLRGLIRVDDCEFFWVMDKMFLIGRQTFGGKYEDKNLKAQINFRGEFQ